MLVRAGCVAAIAAASLLLAFGPGDAQARFQEGLPSLPAKDTTLTEQTTYAAMQAIHGSVVRPNVYWAVVAPKTLPAGFNASDPGDPNYNWTGLDAAVSNAAAHHLQVILTFLDAPSWAQGPGPERVDVSSGAWDPNVNMFAAFLHAVAVRYGGGYPDPANPGRKLPRVKYWEPWNEPNIPGYFSAPDPLGAYRTLQNRAYSVLKAVHGDNVVALGGLAPVTPVPGSIPPLDFSAQLLCVHRSGRGYRTTRRCQRAHFDAYDIHPYSLGFSPTKRAPKRGDTLVGDMPTVSALVRAAGRYPIWATEFDWPTNPPNTQLGDPDPLGPRYVAYSMYEMWKSGVSLVIWEYPMDLAAMDIPGGGLYTITGTPKLILQGFAFPFVAGTGRGSGFGWGRVPVSHPVRVVVERQTGSRWRGVARVKTGSDGIFYARFRARRNGVYRARVIGGATSLPYDSRPIPARVTHPGYA
jgi:hypothetical protein